MKLVEKYCRKCGKLFPITQFKSERAYNCLACHRERVKLDKQKYRKKRRQETRQRYQHNGTKIPKFTRRARAAFLTQYPFCMLCLRTENLVVDHCHETRKLRAVLCTRCNTGLGSFLDNPELLRAAATYVEYFRDPA